MKTEIIMHQRLLAPFSLLFLTLAACSFPLTSGESDAPDIITIEDLQGCYYAEYYHEDSVFHYYEDSVLVSYPTDSVVFSDTIESHIQCERICFEQNIQKSHFKFYRYRWNTKYPEIKTLYHHSEEIGSGSVTIVEPLVQGYDIVQPGSFDYNVAYQSWDSTYRFEGSQSWLSAMQDRYGYKTYSERNGIKYLDEYSSKGWTLCEE